MKISQGRALRKGTSAPKAHRYRYVQYNTGLSAQTPAFPRFGSGENFTGVRRAPETPKCFSPAPDQSGMLLRREQSAIDSSL
ncbi:MAG: hypothetical protein H0X43_13310 [Nitrosospira sp.]|nr:hypothetical protein [Nitrosospira sp.]